MKLKLTIPRVPKLPKKLSELEETFALQCRIAKLPKPEREFMFATNGRKWRFDFAWPFHQVAVECEGGHWSGGRHTRGSGFESDCEKYNQAIEQNWRVFRYTKAMIDSGEAIEQIKRVL